MRIYLRPVVKTTEDLLPPALSLIARHGRRLDPEAALDLLPPLVRAQDVQAFLLSALRAPVFDTRSTRNVAKARTEQVARKLMYLESNRVKVTNTRMYAKRLLFARTRISDAYFTAALNVTSVLGLAS